MEWSKALVRFRNQVWKVITFGKEDNKNKNFS